MPEKHSIEDIVSIFCWCRKTERADNIMDGWDCMCDVLFKDEEEERIFIKHAGLMKHEWR